MPAPFEEERVDGLSVAVYRNRGEVGAAAGAAVAARLRALLAAQPEVRVVFAAAPSQDELLAALAAAPGVDWSRVSAFHMDEYVGLARGAAGSFGRYLRERLFDAVRPGRVDLLDGAAPPELECERYARMLRAAPIDLVCLGIGENGHLAFNDPPEADFDDRAVVKTVALTEASRRQQVHDGCFARLEDVPTHALTLTLPTLAAGLELHCVVPGRSKRVAVERTLRGAVEPSCPASLLRRHERARLYLDFDSYPGRGPA